MRREVVAMMTRIVRISGELAARLWASVLVALTLLFVSATAGATPFDNIFVFGDSNSDTGRRLELEGRPVSPPYYQGRHSNGAVAVEYLASSLGLGLSPASNSFAVGGALTGHGNVDTSHNNVLAATGMLDQFQTFKGLVGGVANPNALYFIWGGGNDITQCGGVSCTSAQLSAIVSNLTTLVADLSGLGARHFMVVNDYGGNSAARSFDAMLLRAVQSLDSQGEEVALFDARSVLLSMIVPNNPYGFTNTSSAAPCYTGDLNGVGGSVCDDPSQYVFWDPEGHLTARANAILGNAMILSVMPEPDTALLVCAALMALAWVVKRTRLSGC